jgi:hypothetical protein
MKNSCESGRVSQLAARRSTYIPVYIAGASATVSPSGGGAATPPHAARREAMRRAAFTMIVEDGPGFTQME